MAAFAALALPGPVSAQDTNYWTNQYGTRSILLGGAVVGGTDDVSATYYNPGFLALLADPGLFLAAKVFDFTNVIVKDAETGDRRGDSPWFRPAPSFFGGSFPLAWLGDDFLGYSLFTRFRSSIRVDDIEEFAGEAIAGGDGVLLGSARLDQSLTETWVGLTWSHALSARVGFGVTQYLAVRSQRAARTSVVQGLGSGGNVGVAAVLDDYSYTDYRLLWKAGLGYDLSPLTLGVTVTTPSLNVFGSGSSGVNLTVSGIDLDGDRMADDVLASDFQSGLSSSYLSPLSIGAGASLALDTWALYVSSEWFNAVDEFTVLDGGEFEAQSTGDTLTNRVTYEASSVLNWAIGLSRTFSDRFAAYASFATDYTAAPDETDTNLAFSSWNIFNVMAGADVRIGRSAFTLGLGYSFAGREQVLGSLPAAGGGRRRADVSYRGLRFVIGYEFGSAGSAPAGTER